MFVANDILFPEIHSLLATGQRVTFTPTGNSMEPFIHGGSDTVTLSRVDEVTVGDILLVHLPSGQYVMHRLIHIAGDELTLRGDGNIAGVEHCSVSDVLGKVVEIRSGSGRRKHLTKARLWQRLFPYRRWLLKANRKIRRLLGK